MSVVNNGIQKSISLNRAAYQDIANSEKGIDGGEGIGISEASAYEDNQKVYSPDTFIFAIGQIIECRLSTQYVHHNYKVSRNYVSHFQRSCADKKNRTDGLTDKGTDGC